MASDEQATLLLELVRGLTAEVHPHAVRRTVTLDSHFDDLGIGSLELAELLRRAQDAFGVALPPHLLANAETPRDLLQAVRRSHAPAGEGRSTVTPLATTVAGSSAPATASTLLDALDWHLGATPQRIHIRILDESGHPDDITYEALHREAAAVAAGLLDRDVMPGDTVAIMLPTSRAYFVTFAGVVLAGAVPVPIYPPARPSQLADHLRRHTGILANAGATLLVTVPEAVSLGRLLRSNLASLRDVVVPAALMGSATGGALPRPRSDDLALVQYTSGSTGQPKGVALTHDNLLANIRAMGQATAVSAADTFVSWLPLYHDMGLIGAWLGCLYFAVPLVAMAPQVFLTRPSRWLWAIHENRGTISAGPNFAYELCLSKIDDAEIVGLDLSSWRLAFNGAEPVSPATIERFTGRFAPYGLRHNTITPVYGLAESAVGLAFPPLGRGPLIDSVERDTFVRTGRADPADADDRDALRFVACGQPLPGHEIRVVDATGNELGDRHEGRIEFRGPSATAGYFHNPDATRSLFHDDWLDTGDLGYIADADVYVTGRVKDVIIRAGRNLHPTELEEAVGNLTGIRRGCVAVFSSPDPSGGAERLVVMAETRGSDDKTAAALRSEIMATTVDLLGVAPDDVVLAPPRTVPKTSSGKIRRAASREIYERGNIGARPRALWWELARVRLRGTVPSMRRARRAAAALAFAAYAWVVYVVLAALVLLQLPLVPRLRWRWSIACRTVRLLARLTGTSVSVHGLDQLPQGPAIVVANHPSWLDGLALATVVPPSFRFVAGEVLEHERLIGFVLERLGAVFVERYEREHGVADSDKVVALVREGRSLVVFPEGHLARAPGLRPFHMGAFVAAAQSGVPIVPVAIRGTREMLRPEHHFPRRGSVAIAVGEPIQPLGTDWTAAVGLQCAARDVILRLSGEPDVE
ncbi:acyl-CoA synthetase (AMP-forming)/AMP-acid ligase II [Mycolicibacterium chubuense NBB4]|uniref:Acyl-CoA synthetase (AMP-forming)/AMP-acid ligase II n=1 Tax=Mycolicibacterium chubuense (strain NBB4) TaxID=710421 RepID=I4BL52_MYCCN|nr:AMP-binding protein [Mycolicibacterium chubuense]AFM18009.1 acyl-CoA synthetase (AMP-forming)/AMP-acid ligase II [Mycolicibacterium chubuense NBB4]